MASVLVGLIVLWAAEAALARTGKQYIFNTASAHWNAAVDTCNFNGARLATVTSQREYYALEQLKNQYSFSVDRYWIGLYNKGPGYVWMDCSSPNIRGFQQWSGSGPDPANNCGQVKRQDTLWYSVSCDDYAPFICEKDTGPCTFSLDVSNTADGDSGSALDNAAATLAECQTKCNGLNTCEYVVYSDTAAWCYLYASKPPGVAAGTGTSTGYTRQCYAGINGNYNINHGTNSGVLPAVTVCDNVTFSPPGEQTETTLVTESPTESPMTSSAQSTVSSSTTTTTSPTSASTTTSMFTSNPTSTSTSISRTSRLPVGTITSDSSAQAITSTVYRSALSDPTTTTESVSLAAGATTLPSGNSTTSTSAVPSGNSATSITAVPSGNSATSTDVAPSGNSVTSTNIVPSGNSGSSTNVVPSGNSATSTSVAAPSYSATAITTSASSNSATDTADSYRTFMTNASTSEQNSSNTPPISTPPSSTNARLGNSSRGCFCRCLNPDMTPDEKKAFTESILARLSINTRTTSAHVRTLTSAPDPRMSAKAVGYSGLVFLTVVIGGILLLDLSRLVSDLKMFKNNVKELLHSRKL